MQLAMMHDNFTHGTIGGHLIQMNTVGHCASSAHSAEDILPCCMKLQKSKNAVTFLAFNLQHSQMHRRCQSRPGRLQRKNIGCLYIVATHTQVTTYMENRGDWNIWRASLVCRPGISKQFVNKVVVKIASLATCTLRTDSYGLASY